MKKVTLYQNNSSGGIKIWTIEVIDNGKFSTILSTAGQQGGKMREDKVDVTIGKGRETHYTQACKDAQSKVNSKTRKGYVTDITKIQSSSVLGIGGKVPQPMLAHKYDPTKKQSSSKNLKEIGIEGKQIMVSKKWDGNRCLIHVTVDSIEMFTRKGDKSPDMKHITSSVRKSFDKIYKYVNEKYGVTEYWLDGELMTHAFSFNKLNGLVRKQTRTAEDEADCLQIKYHIYDVMIDAGYETRYKIIQYFESQTVFVTESIEITATDKELRKMLEKFLAEGEEGLMIRVLGVPYEHKRSWALIKMKLFEDQEYKVVSFEEDKRGGFAGAIVLQMDTKSFDSSGKPILTFNAGLTGSHEEWKEMWENQSKYIGKYATIEYFERNPATNVPRFPKCKGFRNDVPKK